jgi:hypothetical protein
MDYTFSTATNLPTPIGGNLNGKYINFNSLPNSIQILISNPKYVVVVRETTTYQTADGGRTSGTVWYNKQILGFLVEDAVRTKKISLKTAIPDTIQDASKFNGVPSNVYNIVLTTSTGKDFIRKSFIDGYGMRVSSKSDPSGMNIYEADVFVDDDFAVDRETLAYDGVFIHQGTSEKSSAGCLIFSRTRNSDGTLIEDVDALHKLNKYLRSIGLIGKGKLQQLAIVNLWAFPFPSSTSKATVTVVNKSNESVSASVKKSP